MHPSDPRRARGAAVRQARLDRVRMIRRRAVAGALALFVASWLLITVILATGHDPALSEQRTAKVAPASASTTTTSAATTPTSTGSSSATNGSTGAGTSSSTGSSGSAVTSVQS